MATLCRRTVPPSNNPIFAGCFLIAAPDVCYDAKDELTYCWCSSGDLCNGGDGAGVDLLWVLILALGHLFTLS